MVMLYPFSRYENLVNNGTFDADIAWVKDADWSIGSGVATKVAGAGNSNLDHLINFKMKSGATYKTVFTTVVTAGTVAIQIIGTTTASGTPRSASGTYAQNIVAPLSAASNRIRIQGNATFAGTVDEISVTRIA